MKKKLYIKNKANKITYHPDAIIFFTEHKIKNGKTPNGKSFMIMPTEKSYEEFNKKFQIPDNLMVVVKSYSPGNLFAYYNKLCENNEKLLGEITSTNGILGDGIYTITENDFLENKQSEDMINQYNYEQIGYQTHNETIFIVEYFGYYYKVVSNQYKNLCKLITQNIPLDNIKSVLASTISY